ncbi:MAG: zinc-binding alcohol dehydrogenase family protein [Chloroflexota bacterium]|nr:MAG: zinc-binding alcohol dehydrogenase family protein [Chloroflexota bacterium]
MRAFLLSKPASIEFKPLALTDLPVPQPGPGQIRIKVSRCGVCHTDLHTVEGEITPPRLPIVPGHQVVGTIEAIGGEVSDLKLGQRVGVPWLHEACGQCPFCLRGEENLCPYARFTGFHTNGGYAEMMLAMARYSLPIPDSIEDDQAAPLLCAGIIGYRSLRKAGLQPGERLGLVGFGASAHLAIQVARYWGCKVFVFTRSPEHRGHAIALGADWVGGIEDRPDKPIDRAVIFAPSGALVPLTLEKLRPGGTLAINAIHMSNIPAMPYALIYGERTLRSVANATYQDGVDFMKLAASIPIHATVRPYPFEEANRALEDLKHSRISGEAVLIL